MTLEEVMKKTDHEEKEVTMKLYIPISKIEEENSKILRR